MKTIYSKVAVLAFSLFVACGVSANQNNSPGSLKEVLSGLPEDQALEIIMKSGTQLRLTNFNTGKKDLIVRPDKMSAEDFLPYVAPIDQIREFYNFMIEDGKEPHIAMQEANAVALKILKEDPHRGN